MKYPEKKECTTCEKCGLHEWEPGDCFYCEHVKATTPTRMTKVLNLILDNIGGALIIAGYWGLNFIFITHFNYTLSEGMAQSLCLGLIIPRGK